MKSQINFLRLIYPPISNQEAEWLKDDPEVRDQLSGSQLYMICQREQLRFRLEASEQEPFKRTGILNFFLESRSLTLRGTIDLPKICHAHGKVWEEQEIELEIGDKCLRFWLCDGDQREFLDWFTTDKNSLR